MQRPNIIRAVVASSALVLLVGFCLPMFNTISVTTSSVEVYLVITRNGQEVPPDQIRSVGYLFNRQPSQPVQDVKVAVMREARVLGSDEDHWWLLSSHAGFSRSSVLPFEVTSGGLYIRSVSLRVEFADGKIFFSSLPLTVNPQPGTAKSGGEMHIDFSDVAQ